MLPTQNQSILFGEVILHLKARSAADEPDDREETDKENQPSEPENHSHTNHLTSTNEFFLHTIALVADHSVSTVRHRTLVRHRSVVLLLCRFWSFLPLLSPRHAPHDLVCSAGLVAAE